MIASISGDSRGSLCGWPISNFFNSIAKYSGRTLQVSSVETGPRQSVGGLYGILDSAVQSDLQANERTQVGGAEFDSRRHAFRDSVDRSSALDGADVQGGPCFVRIGIARRFSKSGQSRSQDEDGVRSSGVGKAVAARAGDRDLVSAAAKGLRNSGFGSCAVEDDVGSDAAGIGRVLVDVADAAQVAFALFADVADEDEAWRRGPFPTLRALELSPVSL